MVGFLLFDSVYARCCVPANEEHSDISTRHTLGGGGAVAAITCSVNITWQGENYPLKYFLEKGSSLKGKVTLKLGRQSLKRRRSLSSLAQKLAKVCFNGHNG